jgi:hypothetical protein
MNVGSEIDKPILDPQNHSIWIVAGFTIALLALVMSFVSMRNNGVAVAATQMEVLDINKQIQELSERVPAPAPPPSAAVQPQR